MRKCIILSVLALVAVFAAIATGHVMAVPVALLPLLGVLSADAEIQRKQAGLQSFPVYTATTIYKGSLVSLNSTGYAIASADTAGTKFIGIAYEKVANAGDSAALWIRVYTEGTFRLPATSITQAMVGDLMYVVDSGTMDDTAGSTNKIAVGTLVEFETTVIGWVNIGQRA